jgi:5S rRNA maturation endonuclease (ribonuclease M5)
MISSSYIRDYLLKKFQGNYKLISGDRELTIPSVFLDRDPKRHMSINLETGLWQCFKTGEKGNFLHLYCKLEGLAYKEAYRRFLVEEFFNEGTVRDDYEKKVEPEKMPVNFQLIEPNTLEEVNSAAYLFLLDRHIYDYGKFYYSTQAPYKGRLIIPYNNHNGMFYFQARALFGQEPKYLNFRGIKASTILYPFQYDSKAPLYVCEGAIDAISLQLAGFNATTTISCHVSRLQMDQLRYYQGPIVVAYDNDRAGNDGLRGFELLRRRMRLPRINYCFPPSSYKDWNEALVKNKSALIECALKFRPFDLDEWDVMQQLNTLAQ